MRFCTSLSVVLILRPYVCVSVYVHAYTSEYNYLSFCKRLICLYMFKADWGCLSLCGIVLLPVSGSHLSFRLSLSMCLYVSLSACVYGCVSVCMYIRLCVYLSVCLPVCVPKCLPISDSYWISSLSLVLLRVVCIAVTQYSYWTLCMLRHPQGNPSPLLPVTIALPHSKHSSLLDLPSSLLLSFPLSILSQVPSHEIV